MGCNSKSKCESNSVALLPLPLRKTFRTSCAFVFARRGRGWRSGSVAMDASGGEDKGEASDQPLLQGGQESGQGAALGNPFASAEGAVNTIQQQRQQATFAEFKPQLGSNVADEAEASFFSAHGTPASSGITAQEAVQDVGSTTKKPEANSWLPGWAKNEVKEDETKSKLAELQRKEKELAAREKALERRETEAGGAAGSLIPDKTRKNCRSRDTGF